MKRILLSLLLTATIAPAVAADNSMLSTSTKFGIAGGLAGLGAVLATDKITTWALEGKEYPHHADYKKADGTTDWPAYNKAWSNDLNTRKLIQNSSASIAMIAAQLAILKLANNLNNNQIDVAQFATAGLATTVATPVIVLCAYIFAVGLAVLDGIGRR